MYSATALRALRGILWFGMRLGFMIGWCAAASAACVPIPPPPAATGSSNGVQAAAWATEAAALTGAQVAAEHAALNAPPFPTYCGGDYDHECDVGPVRDDRRGGTEGMTLGEARSHALMYVNGMRSLNGVGLVELDDALTAFAQEGSEQLARDHKPHGHIEARRDDCRSCSENQGDPNGWRAGPVDKQIDEIIAGFMAEGPGGGHHDNMLDRRWSRLGVGIANAGETMYFTIDFAP
jgi:uncharacterized protein YkwD